MRDLKQELKDMEEKFHKAMVTNASMDNEKSQLMFQVKNIFNQKHLTSFLSVSRWTCSRTRWRR